MLNLIVAIIVVYMLVKGDLAKKIGRLLAKIVSDVFQGYQEGRKKE